jgi:nickel-dependent lactate racemase
MIVKVAYGRNGLSIELPDSAEIILPRYTKGLPDETFAIRQALRAPIQSPPLSDLIKPGMKIVITHSDITRATPNDRILPVVLDELTAAGIDKNDITLINALGTHRPQTEKEQRAMLGGDIVEQYRCIQHDAFDEKNLVSLGFTSLGHSVRLNRGFLEADLKILTGFIEPHFFAGFSGGPKGILPALAGFESVLTNHGIPMIGHPNSRWGVTKGNPIWEEMSEIASMVKQCFLINVALNKSRQITAVFAGELFAAHAEGCQYVRQRAMVKVDQTYDVVITTNSGYPLDQNLYQSVKGMSAASQIVRQGGAILMAAACEDSLPDYGQYAELLAKAGTIQGLLDMLSQPGFSAHDQWQVQIQAMIQQKADVYLYSDGLTSKQIRRALLNPCKDITGTLKELVDQYGSRICVLPEGPLTIPVYNPRL